ncbi:MAG: hypothetical protein AB7G06_01445, partial [Bdellovibrionales bacterium]
MASDKTITRFGQPICAVGIIVGPNGGGKMKILMLKHSKNGFSFLGANVNEQDYIRANEAAEQKGLTLTPDMVARAAIERKFKSMFGTNIEKAGSIFAYEWHAGKLSTKHGEADGFVFFIEANDIKALAAHKKPDGAELVLPEEVCTQIKGSYHLNGAYSDQNRRLWKSVKKTSIYKWVI